MLITLWCFAATLCTLSSLASARTARGDAIDQQIARIRNTQERTGIRLDNNQDWHDWIMANSQQRMPQRLELFYSNLNRQNMRRRLFYIYKWNIGRRDATREGYTEWLKGLVAWMEETTGVDLPDD